MKTNSALRVKNSKVASVESIVPIPHQRGELVKTDYDRELCVKGKNPIVLLKTVVMNLHQLSADLINYLKTLTVKQNVKVKTEWVAKEDVLEPTYTVSKVRI